MRLPMLKICFCLWLGCGLLACTPIRKLNCSSATPTKDIPWLRDKVKALEQDKERNENVEIYRYDYRNRTVFWITGYGADRPSELYECDGEKVCEPDGGLTGRGDGKCPDFFQRREHETVVWKLKDVYQLYK